MSTTQDLEKGKIIKLKGELWAVLEREHHKPGKGVTVVRSRLKNLATGSVLEHTFKAGETVAFVEIERKKFQYLYSDERGANFMDEATYESYQIPHIIMEGREKYLREGESVTALYYGEKPVQIEIPTKVKLKVTSAPPAIRGNTASGNVTKKVTLETGLLLDAPLFINEGDDVIVNTEKGEYAGRA